MARDRVQYELTPQRKNNFNRLMSETGMTETQLIDHMTVEFIKVLNDETIIKIEYRDKHDQLRASVYRNWFLGKMI